MLEALYVLHCPAPAELQLFRHMPNAMVRVLLDAKGKDLNGVLSIDQLGRLLQKIPRHNAQEIVRRARPALVEMIQSAEQQVQPQQALLIEAAQQSLNEELLAELDRLKALAQVNPNVRQSEIEYLQARLTQSEQYLSQATLRLDALRVIMTL
jgi:ATP-dependent helicase HepA